MSNFKIGEKVVCVDDTLYDLNKTQPRIKKGEIYTVIGLSKCCCNVLMLKEVPNIGVKKCNCGKILQSNFYYSSRFRKLDYAHTERICAEIIESLKVEEFQHN